MSNNQPNAWQTASRTRTSNSATRTPQNRSNTQSPSQSTPPTHPPRQDASRPAPAVPVNNVWAQRSTNTSAANVGNGPAKSEVPSGQEDSTHTPINGFNAAEIKEAMRREVGNVATYKPAEAAATGSRNSGGSAWGPKPNNMANNQPFFTQLAKQVATMEGGG